MRIVLVPGSQEDPVRDRPPDDVDARTVFANLRRHLAPQLAVTTRLAGSGAVETAADGARVQLSDGRTVLDFGSYAVTLLGHGHPAIVAAVQRQLHTMPTSTRILANPVAATAAARIAGYLGHGLDRVYFGANGADAVEAAVKLARLASGHHRILAVEGGFHGKSLGALALTHHERYRSGLTATLPHVSHVAPDDPDAVARELAHGDVAALVFEPVQGENGVHPLPLDILRQWCDAATRHGAFVIADEIQTGLRRAGERSLALAAGLPLDAVLLGKPLGGGILPLSAAVCTERLYAPLTRDAMIHTATFSGHPLACAALPAALDTIEELADRAAEIAATVERGLAELRVAHPDAVRAVRGRGLLWAIELTSADLAGRVVLRLAQQGLLLSPCLGRPEAVRILPPMVASDTDLTEALALLGSTLAQVAAREPASAGAGN